MVNKGAKSYSSSERSFNSILLYTMGGPYFGAVAFPIFSFETAISLDAIAKALLFSPVLAIAAFPLGFFPALLTGCLSATISPHIAKAWIYIGCSTVIGAIITGGIYSGFSGGRITGGSMAAIGAFASLCCALVTSLFRVLPDHERPPSGGLRR
jgi:hypothetical protein